MATIACASIVFAAAISLGSGDVANKILSNIPNERPYEQRWLMSFRCRSVNHSVGSKQYNFQENANQNFHSFVVHVHKMPTNSRRKNMQSAWFSIAGMSVERPAIKFIDEAIKKLLY